MNDILDGDILKRGHYLTKMNSFIGILHLGISFGEKEEKCFPVIYFANPDQNIFDIIINGKAFIFLTSYFVEKKILEK